MKVVNFILLFRKFRSLALAKLYHRCVILSMFYFFYKQFFIYFRAIHFSVFQAFSRTDRERQETPKQKHSLLQGSALRDKSKLCDN